MPTLPDRVIRLIGYHVCAMAAQALSSMPDADRKKEIRAFLAISHVCREFYFNLLPAIFANLQFQVDNLSQAISATQMNGILSCVGSLSFAHGLDFPFGHNSMITILLKSVQVRSVTVQTSHTPWSESFLHIVAACPSPFLKKLDIFLQKGSHSLQAISSLISIMPLLENIGLTSDEDVVLTSEIRRIGPVFLSHLRHVRLCSYGGEVDLAFELPQILEIATLRLVKTLCLSSCLALPRLAPYFSSELVALKVRDTEGEFIRDPDYLRTFTCLRSVKFLDLTESNRFLLISEILEHATVERVKIKMDFKTLLDGASSCPPPKVGGQRLRTLHVLVPHAIFGDEALLSSCSQMLNDFASSRELELIVTCAPQ